MTPLADRMKLHKTGQLTWPEPELKRMCDQCDHFTNAGVKTPGKGRCALVRAHQNADGAVFKGAEAIACPKFRSKY